jgi:hypothetical protein
MQRNGLPENLVVRFVFPPPLRNIDCALQYSLAVGPATLYH